MPAQNQTIAIVVGARPHFIKCAPLIEALNQFHDIDIQLIHTGQHYDYALSGAFFEELSLPEPNYHLNVGSAAQDQQIAQILLKLSDVWREINPQLVIVIGDTNTTAAAALSASVHKIPIAHLEAGLREWNKQIPEEINKIVTDSLTDLYLCPTPSAVNNLKNQGITKQVYLTGEITLDLLVKHHIDPKKLSDLLSEYGFSPKGYYFMTLHRASNTDSKEAFYEIIQAIKELKEPVIWPMHPRTSKAAKEYNLMEDLVAIKHLKLIEPLPFHPTQLLISAAKMVITDSGGIIREAYHHHVRTLIIDKQTEWIEIVNEGWAIITGPDKDLISYNIANFTIPIRHSNVLGDGESADRIAKIIYEFISK